MSHSIGPALATTSTLDTPTPATVSLPAPGPDGADASPAAPSVPAPGGSDQAIVRVALHEDHHLVAERLRRALAPHSDRAVVMHATQSETTELVLALETRDLVALLSILEVPPQPGDGARTSVLSPREEEVVALVAAGLANRDIAARLFLTDNTLKSYIRSAYRKMGVRTRSQAVGWAFSQGLA